VNITRFSNVRRACILRPNAAIACPGINRYDAVFDSRRLHLIPPYFVRGCEHQKTSTHQVRISSQPDTACNSMKPNQSNRTPSRKSGGNCGASRLNVGRLKLDELQNFPQFLVRDKFRQGEWFYLEGEFRPRFDTSSSCFGDLFVVKPPSTFRDAMFGVLWTKPDESSSILEYHSNWDCKEIAVGALLPCGRGRLGLRQVLLILDVDTNWETRRFQASDAWSYTSSPGWRSTLQPGRRPPKGAKKVKKLTNGWDHEHCIFCHATISEHAEPTGYVAKDAYGAEQWACCKCYQMKVVPHAL
jgi:hypothetical protein